MHADKADVHRRKAVFTLGSKFRNCPIIEQLLAIWRPSKRVTVSHTVPSVLDDVVKKDQTTEVSVR